MDGPRSPPRSTHPLIRIMIPHIISLLPAARPTRLLVLVLFHPHTLYPTNPASVEVYILTHRHALPNPTSCLGSPRGVCLRSSRPIQERSCRCPQGRSRAPHRRPHCIFHGRRLDIRHQSCSSEWHRRVRTQRRQRSLHAHPGPECVRSKYAFEIAP